MKRFLKPTFILGLFFIVIVSSIATPLLPAHAANNDVNKDKDRRAIKALHDCMDKSIIDEDDSIDNYSDVFDDNGRKKNVVVGLDMSSDTGTITCLSAVRLGLKAMGKGTSNSEVEAYFIEYITGKKFIQTQTIKNDSSLMLSNMNKLKAEAQAAYAKTEAPSNELRVMQVAGLVNACFTADKGGGSGYDESRGDFKVAGLGTFQQKENTKPKDYSWLNFDKNHNTYKVGDLSLNFVNWNQDNSDGSTDFYPLRSDISQTRGYFADSVVDCHFVKKNKDWIFAKGVTIVDNKVVFTDVNGEPIEPNVASDLAANEAEPSCATTSTNPMSWAICPIVNGLADLTDWIFSKFIIPLLETSPIVISPGSPIFNVWSGFRVIANIILVLVFMVMIFGQAIGGGLVDAYTAKKVIPRVVIGAIGINLSIYISAIMVDITNVIGNGVGLIIVGPFLSSADVAAQEYKPGGLSSVIALVVIILSAASTVLIVKRLTARKKTGSFGKYGLKGLRSGAFGGLVKSALSWVLLFIGIPVAIAAISIFVTLILRTGIIILFSVASPIAIALWILPSTEQYFKKWFNTFVKALMVYPIIVVLFAMGDVLAYAFGGNMLDNPDPLGVNGVIAIFAQFLPLFMIAYAFKIAGGILGGINETLLKRGKQGSEFVKGSENDPNSLRNRTKRKLGEGATRVQADAAHNYLKNGTRGLSGLAGRLANIGNVDNRLSGYNKASAERRDTLRSHGPDDLLYAAGGTRRRKTDGSIGFYNSKGKEISERLYKKGKSLYGDGIHDLQSNIGYALEKTQTDEDAQNMQYSFLQNAQEMGLSEEEATQAWQGITYPLKGRFASMKYAAPKKQADGSFAFDSASDMQLIPAGTPSAQAGHAPVPLVPHTVTAKQQRARLTDIHRARQSFKLSEIGDQDWRSLADRQFELEDVVMTGGASQEQQAELLQTYEVFDAASQKLRTLSPDAEDESTTSGPTAAAQVAINDANARRKLAIQENPTTPRERRLAARMAGPMPPDPRNPSVPAPRPVVPVAGAAWIDTTNY